MQSKPNSSAKKVNAPFGRLLDRAALALAHALDRGATPLEAQIVYEVAAQPGPNWMPGRELIERINARTGADHHPGSGRRSVRNAQRKGLLGVTRVLPFQTPPGARYSSPHGTTSKRVLWSGLRTRDPISKHELSRMRGQARAHSRYRTIESPSVGGLDDLQQAPTSPRHAATPAMVPRAPGRSSELYAEFSAMAQSAIDATERREQARDSRRDQATLAAIRAKGRAPP
jgi:hypothetical protein